MANGNMLVEGSSAEPLNLVPLIREICNTLKKWNTMKGPNSYKGFKADLIPFLAIDAVKGLERNDSRNDSSYLNVVSSWKPYGGGCISPESYQQIDMLKGILQSDIQNWLNYLSTRVQDMPNDTDPSLHFDHSLEKSGIRNANSYMGKNEAEISTYAPASTQVDSSNSKISSYSCTLSFDWDILRKNFALSQIGECNRAEFEKLERARRNGEIDSDDEDYLEMINQKRALDSYAKNNLEMQDSFCKYLMPKILFIAADCLEKDQYRTASDKDIQDLRLYTGRLQEFIQKADSEDLGFGDPYGFRSFIYNKLPVIPIIRAEEVLNASNGNDPKYFLELNTVFKLNGINSPSNSLRNVSYRNIDNENSTSKNPLEVVLRQIRSVHHNEKEIYRSRQLYALMYYLDHGILPPFSPEKMGAAMRNYLPSMDYNRLAHTLNSVRLTTVEPWTGYLCFDEISVEDKHNNTKIHLSDNKSTYSTPVICRIVQRSFEQTDGQKRRIIYQKKESGAFTEMLLSQPHSGATSQNNKYDFVFSKMEPKTVIWPETETANKIRLSANEIILYDIAYATIWTLFVELSVKIYQKDQNDVEKVQLLLGRFSDGSDLEKKDKEEKGYPITPGSNIFLKALGYAAEQSVASDHLITRTQGYIRDKNTYKDKNAANSILQFCDIDLNKSYPDFDDGIGIVYLTARLCDKNYATNGQDAGVMQILMANALEIITPKQGDTDSNTVIRRLPPTNRITSKDDVYVFNKGMELSRTLSQMQSDGIKEVILLMDAPYQVPSSQSEQSITGLSNDNILTLEDEFQNLTFLPLFIGDYQIRANQSGEYYAIRDLYKTYQSGNSWSGGNRTPLNAYVLGHKVAKGYQDGYRTGTLYEVIRDYYGGRTGDLITLYFDELNGKKFREKVFMSLLLLHLITNDKYNRERGEGKCSPFARLKQDIAPDSIVAYSRTSNNNGPKQTDFTFNYTAYLSVVTSVAEKKESLQLPTHKGVGLSTLH